MSRKVTGLAMLGAVAAVAVVALVVLQRTDGDGWSAGLEQQAYSYDLVAAEGTVCATSAVRGSRDELACWDARTGDERFSTRVGEATVETIADGTLLVRDQVESGTRLAAYTLDGTELWSWAGAATGDSVVVADGTVVIQQGGRLIGIDLATGERLWLATGPRLGTSDLSGEVSTDGRRAYVTGLGPDRGPSAIRASALVAIAPTSGEVLWRAELGQRELRQPRAVAMAPFDDESAAAFAVEDGFGSAALVVLDTATGELRWQADLPPTTMAGPSVAHIDRTTVASAGDRLYGFGPTGEDLWTVQAPIDFDDADATDDLEVVRDIERFGRLVAAGDALYLLSGGVRQIDPTTGESQLVIEGPVHNVIAVAGHLIAVDGERIEGRRADGQPTASP